MTKTMDKKDVVVVGFGWSGSVMAKEMTEAGLSVVALERGEYRDTSISGAYPRTIDELTYNIRHRLFQDLSKSTVTIRHTVNDTALPYRQLAAFLPGTGVGGAGLHWSGVHWRIMPEDLLMRSHYEQRYGKGFIPEGMTIQDWGVTYEQLEPFFDKGEKLCGTSGTAWSIKGQIVGEGKGGNKFSADRSNDFPLPAQKNSVSAEIFKKATESLGYHPYNLASANTSQSYVNIYGCQMGACTFCGYCSGYACYNYSKASPNVCVLPALKQTPLFELRPNSYVLRIELAPDKKTATGVTYVDATGTEIFQPADIVIVSAFQFHNVHLLLMSGIGHPYDPVSNTGVVGRNFAYQNMGTMSVYFDQDQHCNHFMGAGGNGIGIDDFNADNFDHGPAGFVGGSPIWLNQAGTKPISGYGLPPGTPAWGSAWKKASAEYYNHSASFDQHAQHPAYRANYLSLDPTYRNIFGQPLLRMTLDWQPNDIRLSQFMAEKMTGIAKAMGAKIYNMSGKKEGQHLDTRSYQTTHLYGGAIMGTDPTTSVVNTSLQSWDVHNVFVAGASAFPQGIGYNPTGTVLALAYWSAHAIRERYLKNPGPLG